MCVASTSRPEGAARLADVVRVFYVDRGLLSRSCTGEEGLAARETFDSENLPDGLPFLLEEDWTQGSCRQVNTYLRAAARQRAYSPTTLRNDIVGPLRRLLVFVRDRQGCPVELGTTSTDDLVAYKEHRRRTIGPSSWANEASILSGFFHYAIEAGWTATDPFPRWGTQRRSTLVDRVNDQRLPRCLSEPQLRAFLEIGLRADEDSAPPSTAERDHLYGLTLASTGVRREEGAFLLDCELPGFAAVGPSGAATMTRYGKGHRPRTVLLPAELLRHCDLYRRGERAATVQRAQPALRRRLRAGTLIVVDDIVTGREDPILVIDGQRRPASLVENSERRRLVRRNDDGTIEPLALFIARTGLAPDREYWNDVFTHARGRVLAFAPEHHPRLSSRTTPHVLRHTFAVRMLAGLMALGQQRASNPYQLLTNPVLTVQQLLGHVSPETTYGYLRVAAGYESHVPTVLTAVVASLTTS